MSAVEQVFLSGKIGSNIVTLTTNFLLPYNQIVSGLERNWQACRLQLTLQSSRLRQIFYCFFNLNVSGLERNWQACRLQSKFANPIDIFCIK